MWHGWTVGVGTAQGCENQWSNGLVHSYLNRQRQEHVEQHNIMKMYVCTLSNMMLRWIHWYALDMEYKANRKMMSHRRRNSKVRGSTLLGISDSVTAAAAASASQFDVCANSSVDGADVTGSQSISHGIIWLQSPLIITVVSSFARLGQGPVGQSSVASLYRSDIVSGFSDPLTADDILSRFTHVHSIPLKHANSPSRSPSSWHPPIGSNRSLNLRSHFTDRLPAIS